MRLLENAAEPQSANSLHKNRRYRDESSLSRYSKTSFVYIRVMWHHRHMFLQLLCGWDLWLSILLPVHKYQLIDIDAGYGCIPTAGLPSFCQISLGPHSEPLSFPMPRRRWGENFPEMQKSLLPALRNPPAPALLSDTGSNANRQQFFLQVLQHAEPSAHSKSCRPRTPEIAIACEACSSLTSSLIYTVMLPFFHLT